MAALAGAVSEEKRAGLSAGDPAVSGSVPAPESSGGDQRHMH